MRAMRTAVTIGFVAATAVTAWANDGWYVGTGGPTPFGSTHPSIQMLREDLRIDLRDGRADFDVTFVFKNHGRSTTVTMGFPEERGNLEEPDIVNFATWVDGVRVKAQRKSLMADRVNRQYRAVWLKRVFFAAGGSRRVRVKYSTSISGNTSEQYFVEYILLSARSWKQPIMDFKVTVDWSRLRTRSKPEFTILRKGATWEVNGRKRRTMRLRNFTPNQNLVLDMRLGFWNFRVNGRKIPQPRLLKDREGRLVEPTGLIHGSGRDPFIDSERMGLFFGVAERELSSEPRTWEEWLGPNTRAVGGIFTVSEKGLAFENSRNVVHRIRTVLKNDERTGRDRQYVSLRDVVRALGGTSRYLSYEECFEIRLPPRPPSRSSPK